MKSMQRQLMWAAIVIFVVGPLMNPSAMMGQQDKDEDKDKFLNWYYNVDKNRVAINGYDLVSYHHNAKPVKGDARQQVTYEGIVYRFANDANKKKFAANPKKYLPQFGGWCAFLMGVDGKNGPPPRRFPPNPTHFKIVDGKLYLFLRRPNVDGKKRWEANAETMIKNANAFWASRIQIGKKYGAKPAGLHPLARMETLQFQFFIGQWKSKYKVRLSTTQPGYSPEIQGMWKAWYGWDGFAIYDDWKQVGAIGGNSGPAIRSYDPINQKWVMHYIPINAPIETVWAMTGKFDEKGELHGEMKGSDGRGNKFLQRIHFINISADHFSWRSDRSYDGGKTWIKDWGVGENYRVKSEKNRG